MNTNSDVVSVEIKIDKSAETVWKALITPDIVKEYMFGTTVVSDFKEGSDIRWSGEWQGKRYEDKGKILEVQDNMLLKYSHFSPMTGQPDIPENYHTVTMSLQELDGSTRISLEQDNAKTKEAKSHAEKNWRGMLERLKEVVESSN